LAAETTVLVAITLLGACADGAGRTPVGDGTVAIPDARGDREEIDAAVDAATDAATAEDGAATECAKADLYVAPDGQGTACSCAAPCALTTGRDRARGRAPTTDGDVVVLLRGGTYRLTETFRLGGMDSGVGGRAVVYRASPGESPILSGAIAVTGFAPADPARKVWVADVPAGTRSRQLYVDGRRATRARTNAPLVGYAKTATGFALGDPAIASWPDRDRLEVVGTRIWKMFRCPVREVSAAGIAVAAPCWADSQAHQGYTFDEVSWLENARELLDEPGEFFLDEARSKLWYAPRPGEDLAKARVELPVLEELVRVEGTPAAPVQGLAFEGIAFEYATWLGPSSPNGYPGLQAGMIGSPEKLKKTPANVTVRAARRIRFSSCRFAHLGGAALAFEHGARSNLVERSRFEDVSSSAVMVGDVIATEDHHPVDPELVLRDNTVTTSYVTRIGAEYFDAVGLFAGYTTRTTFTKNELFDLPYTGISLGWGWGFVDVGGPGGFQTPTPSEGNLVEGNLISHHMRQLRDGGAVYTLGAQPGTMIRGNFAHNQGNAYGTIYLDNGTQGVSVTRNLVLVDAKADLPPGEELTRAYWLYVQVYDPIAKNNTVDANTTNDASLFTPKPIDPSNALSPPAITTRDGLAATEASIAASAGTPLRSPEIALGKRVTASSEFDAQRAAAKANNGNAYDGWSPTPADTRPWWQVDLGASVAIDAVEVVTRWAIDQPVTRRSFRIIASNDPTFATFVVLGEVDAAGLPHRAIFATDVSPPKTARYVRVEKTADGYFFLGEVRIHGK
jgi:hypothetical protein